MSKPIRYTQNIKCVEPSSHAQNICSGMVECSIGEWVQWQDYARLKAEVERLRKAGDDLEFLVCFNYEGDIKGDEHCIKILDAWNAAKEGKPSV